jgi:hypothetical protein
MSPPARLLGIGLVMVGAAIGSVAGESNPRAAKAAGAYVEAKGQLAAQPEDVERAWLLGRACFDLAEFATNNTQRATLAREGIAACQTAVAFCPTSAPAHYYLGMNRGQLARTMTLGAIKLVDAMEQDFLQAQRLDPSFDQAGPDRNLGLLYHQAPGWPVSVGNQTKARQRLEKAVELAPIYPGNRLNLMEAYAEWGELELLRRGFTEWDKQLEQARSQYAGDQWQGDWQDWEQRIERLQRRFPRASANELPTNEGG